MIGSIPRYVGWWALPGLLAVQAYASASIITVPGDYPTIQGAILAMPPVTNGRDPVTERQLRPITGEADWNRQLTMWRQINV